MRAAVGAVGGKVKSAVSVLRSVNTRGKEGAWSNIVTPEAAEQSKFKPGTQSQRERTWFELHRKCR